MGLIADIFGINSTPDVPAPQLAKIAASNAATRAAGTSSTGALKAQEALLQALKAQKGIQNQTDVYGQLQDVAAGQGPNPAQALLNNATGQNVASTAALMAGARGATANPGLIARQAAQVGSGVQQQAVGQGAGLQAQQGLNAIGMAGNLANQQVANQMGATGALNQFAQNRQAMENAALANFNQAQVANQGSVNAANAGIQQQGMKSRSDVTGGFLGGVGSAFGLLAEGGDVQSPEPTPTPVAPTDDLPASPAPTEAPLPSHGPASAAGRFFKGLASSPAAPTDPAGRLLQALGGETDVGSTLKQGGHVPGKPKVGGAIDSYSNDTVNAKLSPGEIVLPRSVTKSADPVEASMRFVQAVMEKKKRGQP